MIVTQVESGMELFVRMVCGARRAQRFAKVNVHQAAETWTTSDIHRDFKSHSAAALANVR